VIGERELGDARPDNWPIYLDWFECWLYARPERIEGMPRLLYYTMDRNAWRTAQEWPPPGVELQRCYLRRERDTRLGDAVLTVEPPVTTEPADSFDYNPGQPVASVSVGAGQFSGARDYKEVELRDDILWFGSAPLEEGLEVTGFVTAVLYISSSAPDSDFVSKLVDVYPDGRAFRCRASDPSRPAPQPVCPPSHDATWPRVRRRSRSGCREATRRSRAPVAQTSDLPTKRLAGSAADRAFLMATRAVRVT
jgi:putative CocE/NonD family hydrolase